MKNCGIYKILSPSGRIYIGQSIDIKRRWSDYNKISGTKGQIKLHRSFKKYGKEAHHFDIIEYCEVEQLNCSERFWQEHFEVIGENGLNCVLQECGEKRKVYTQETINRIRQSKLGDKNPMFGKKRTEESKRKQGDSIRGENNYNWGKIYSEEERQKVSIIRKEKGLSKRGKNANARPVLCTQTGIFYDCAKDASEAYNIEYRNLIGNLNSNNKRRNLTTLVYADDYVYGRPITREKITQFKKVLNVITGEIYESVQQASEVLIINYSTLKNKLNGSCRNNTNLTYL